MECTFCKKAFSTKSSLTNHEKTNKSCIALRMSNGIVIDKKKFDCMFCKKELTSNMRLQNHLSICKVKIKNDMVHELSSNVDEKLGQLSFELRNHKEEVEYELQQTKEEMLKTKEEIRYKDKQIQELTEQLKLKPQKITNKNTTNNTTNIEHQTNNITIYQLMTPELVEDFFKKHYNLDTLLGGQKALARFVNDGFLKKAPVYLCGDRSRQKFYIMKDDGKKTEDTDCDEILKLTTPGLPSVKQVYNDALFTEFTEDVTEDDIQDNYRDICSMKHDRSDFKAELSKIAPSSEESLSNTNTNWKQVLEDMERDMLPNESRISKEIKEVGEIESIRSIRKPDVLGYSRGKLMVYRDRYRKDGTIKGPKSIMEQIEHDTNARKEYVLYLESFD